MGLQNQVREIVRQEGMVARKEHPGLTGSMARLPWQGELVSVLPGVGVPAGSATDQGARVLAPSRWNPDAVLTGRTAARLTFSPSLPGSEVECAFAVGPRPAARVPVLPTQGSSGARRPPAGVPVSCPSLTALDLCAPHGGDGIARVLRTRTATLAGLWEAFALTDGRRRNPDRGALLLDSCDEPWSAAERLAHRLLRGAGVTGWKVNWPVTIEGADLLPRHHLPRAEASRRDRGPAARGRPRGLRGRSLAAERPRPRRLDPPPLHLADARRAP